MSARVLNAALRWANARRQRRTLPLSVVHDAEDALLREVEAWAGRTPQKQLVNAVTRSEAGIAPRTAGEK